MTSRPSRKLAWNNARLCLACCRDGLGLHQVLGSTRLGRRRSLFGLDREAFAVPHLPMLRVEATWTGKSDGRGLGLRGGCVQLWLATPAGADA